MSGISGKTSELDEENVVEATTAETSRRALGEVLGPERRDRILAALYIVRQDGILVVRQTSTQIWQALVHNTPRTGIPIPLSTKTKVDLTTLQFVNFFLSFSTSSFS